MFVCVCNQVTDHEIREAVKEGACTIECLQEQLKVATCCGRCKNCAKKIVNENIHFSAMNQDNRQKAFHAPI